MNEQQTFKGNSEFNQIGQLLQKFLPYWPLFVISVALSIAIAYIKLRAEEPIYIANAKVLFKGSDKSSDSKVLDEFNITGDKKVENEVLVLRSAGLMQEVVRRLNLSATVFNQGRVRVEELYKGNSPVEFIPLRRDSINGGGQHFFNVDWSKGQVEIDNKKVPFNGTVNIANTEYKVLPNPSYNKNVVGKNYFVVFNSVEGAADGLTGSVNANPISVTSSVIDVSIYSPVPEKGKDVLTTLFTVYNEFALIDKNQTARNTLNFIEDRLATVALQLDSIEQNVVDFRTEAAPFDLQAQAQSYFSQANAFDQQKSAVDLQLNVLNNIKNYVNNGGTVPALGVVNDPTLTNLITQLQQAQTKLQEISATDGLKSDKVIALKDQINTLRSSILENINNLQNTLTTTKGSYSSSMGRNTAMLKRNPQKEKAFSTISRQQGVKNTIYNFLLEKREETALSSAAIITDLRVLETASAYGPVSPVPKSVYTKWFLIGFIIPAVFVFLKDKLNRRVQLRQEIESKTDVPIVAEIAQINSDSPIVIREGKRTAIAEQFRALRTNLTFMGLTEKTNTIMITSSTSGEGKSFTAINLAVSFTLIGKKVALLELDLRKPKVSKLLQLKNDVGISNYLVNQAAISDIIKPTEIKDLFVLPSGIIPPNPAELIQKDKFHQLMKEVKERFDYVIIDTAPVGPVADSFLLREFVDATIFVVRQNRTQRGHITLIDELNKKKKFKNLCLIFNGIKHRGIYGAYNYSSGYLNSNSEGYYVTEGTEDRIKVFGNRIKRSLGIKN